MLFPYLDSSRLLRIEADDFLEPEAQQTPDAASAHRAEADDEKLHGETPQFPASSSVVRISTRAARHRAFSGTPARTFCVRMSACSTRPGAFGSEPPEQLAAFSDPDEPIQGNCQRLKVIVKRAGAAAAEPGSAPWRNYCAARNDETKKSSGRKGGAEIGGHTHRAHAALIIREQGCIVRSWRFHTQRK